MDSWSCAPRHMAGIKPLTLWFTDNQSELSELETLTLTQSLHCPTAMMRCMNGQHIVLATVDLLLIPHTHTHRSEGCHVISSTLHLYRNITILPQQQQLLLLFPGHVSLFILSSTAQIVSLCLNPRDELFKNVSSWTLF